MHYRTLFVSDVHLGSKSSSPERLLAFFDNHTCDRLFLVGDIIDLWALKRKSYFPNSHAAVVRRIFEIAKTIEVNFIVGNHDAPLRAFLPFVAGNIRFEHEMVFQGLNNMVYLVTHGDAYDAVMPRWLYLAGDVTYTALLVINRKINFLRKKLGMKSWSISAFAKRRVKKAVNFIADFEKTVALDIETRGLNGVICGHIHNCEIRNIGMIQYINSGDFCESCTAIGERPDGIFEIIQG